MDTAWIVPMKDPGHAPGGWNRAAHRAFSSAPPEPLDPGAPIELVGHVDDATLSLVGSVALASAALEAEFVALLADALGANAVPVAAGMSTMRGTRSVMDWIREATEEVQLPTFQGEALRVLLAEADGLQVHRNKLLHWGWGRSAAHPDRWILVEWKNVVRPHAQRAEVLEQFEREAFAEAQAKGLSGTEMDMFLADRGRDLENAHPRQPISPQGARVYANQHIEVIARTMRALLVPVVRLRTLLRPTLITRSGVTTTMGQLKGEIARALERLQRDPDRW